jgi:penicillin-insensitive murein DD-endopeptidase
VIAALFALCLLASPADAAAEPASAVTSPAVPPPTPTLAAAALSAAAVWNAQRTPARGSPEALGGYSAGCLQGAQALPASGPGYEALHRLRNRFFGHPTLVDFIRRLGAAAQARHLGLVVVGDLSQARGGPTPSGHRSHQSGLDVDIGYRAPPGARAGRIKKAERERIAPPAVVDLTTHQMSPLWSRRSERLLATAASDPAVDRIFINPAIRRLLCASPARHEPWFARLRPWWGHHDHFHVRLKCPADSPLCKPQDPPPPEDDEGCGATLAWWFSSDASATQTRKSQNDEAQGPVLPEACAALLAPTP